MIGFSIQPDARQMAELEKDLAEIPRAVPRIMSRAINKVAVGARSEIVKTAAGEINLTQREIRNRNIRLTKANYSSLEAHVRIIGRRIPLRRFGARPATPSPKTQRRIPGTSYLIRRAGGRTVAKGAFTAAMRSGHIGIFRRKVSSRLPIIELFGPSVPVVMEGLPEMAQEVLERRYGERLEREIDRQVVVLLGQREKRYAEGIED